MCIGVFEFEEGLGKAVREELIGLDVLEKGVGLFKKGGRVRGIHGGWF